MINIIIDDYRDGYDQPNFGGISLDDNVEFPCQKIAKKSLLVGL